MCLQRVLINPGKSQRFPEVTTTQIPQSFRIESNTLFSVVLRWFHARSLLLQSSVKTACRHSRARTLEPFFFLFFKCFAFHDYHTHPANSSENDLIHFRVEAPALQTRKKGLG